MYDKNDCIVYVGGEDEVVQFSEADESRNLNEGCRIGLKVMAPDDAKDLSQSTLEMNGINYASGDFLESVNGEKQRFFNIYPILSKQDNEIRFKVKWQEGTKEQEYKVEILEGTKFMQKDGSVEYKL